MQKFLARKNRARAMMRELNKLWPNERGTALNHSNPWELLVATILSAQCTDKRVNIVTEKLFKKYRKLSDYVRANPKEFERDIYSTGFYKNKAKNILAAAKLLQEKWGGKVPETAAELMKVPGVGRKTAVVVLSNILKERDAGIAVDTHVRRFAIRFDLSDYRDPKKIEQDLLKLLPRKDWFAFHNKLIYYGREMCPARKHDCAIHPLTKVYPKAALRWPKAS